MICSRRASLTLLLFALVLPARATWVSPFISEIHYDNVGADVNESIAVTGPGGLDLSGWRLDLYNGANGLVYRTVTLSGRLGGSDGLWAERSWPVDRIQNGPDAVALVSPADRLIDFVAYEAVVVASDGVASGAVARLLPVSEDAGTAVTSAMQREGTADDWTWSLGLSTPGQVNPGLTGFDTATVPAVNAWQLWMSGILAWLLLPGADRLWPSRARLKLQRCRLT